LPRSRLFGCSDRVRAETQELPIECYPVRRARSAPPRRWYGVLPDEPATLPWGVWYEIALTSVAYREVPISIQGGLRASYTPDADEQALPNVQAGDQVALVAQAGLRQLFRDEGAFDRRAYLRSQGLDLTAELRSTELLKRIAPAKPLSLVLRGLPRNHGSDQFNEAADATGSAEQSATINNRAPPGIRDFSCIARVKTVPRSRQAFSPQ